MQLKPLFDVCVIRPYKLISSAGGIVIPRDADNFHEDIGRVVACGLGDIDENGTLIRMYVKEGDIVMYSTHGHQVTKVNGEELIVLRQKSIIGVVELTEEELARAAQQGSGLKAVA